MALVRELIRRTKRNLRLMPAPGSIAPDMLIGAGCVAETGCVFISFEQFGLAPHFRRAAESGTIKIHELDGPAIAGGCAPRACDLPYGLIPDMCTDLPRVNPQTYQPVARAPGERAMLKVPAIHLDVVLLHAQQADELGNVQYFGPVFFDVLMAQAAKKVIVSVDRIVPTDRDPARQSPDQAALGLRAQRGRGAIRRPSDLERRPVRGRRRSSRGICQGERRRGVVHEISRHLCGRRGKP